MVRQRENTFVMIIQEPALSRIKNNQCPVCGKPKRLWNRRTDWRCCSVECTSKFEDFCIIRRWTDLRDAVFRKDDYTCVKCGIQPTHKKPLWGQSVGYVDYIKKDKFFIHFEGDYPKKFAIMIDDTQLIADHIKPIALGGKQWDIENIQTLCLQCNKKKTKQDQKEIAKLRRIEKKLVNGQKQLEGGSPNSSQN